MCLTIANVEHSAAGMTGVRRHPGLVVRGRCYGIGRPGRHSGPSVGNRICERLDDWNEARGIPRNAFAGLRLIRGSRCTPHGRSRRTPQPSHGRQGGAQSVANTARLPTRSEATPPFTSQPGCLNRKRGADARSRTSPLFEKDDDRPRRRLGDQRLLLRAFRRVGGPAPQGASGDRNGTREPRSAQLRPAPGCTGVLTGLGRDQTRPLQVVRRVRSPESAGMCECRSVHLSRGRGVARLSGVGVFVVLALVMAACCRASTRQASVAQRPALRPQRLLIISLPGAAWAQLDATGLPNLDRLLSRSAVADLTNLTAKGAAHIGDGYATVSSGTRAASDAASGGLAFDTTERIAKSSAAQEFARRTGFIVPAGIVNLGIAWLASINAGEPYGAKIGALGDGLAKRRLPASRHRERGRRGSRRSDRGDLSPRCSHRTHGLQGCRAGRLRQYRSPTGRPERAVRRTPRPRQSARRICIGVA